MSKPSRRAGKAVRPAPVARAAGGAALLYRGSAWFFAAFACAVLVAFWPTYYSRLDAQPTYHPHAHGLAMTMWCVMLVTQVWLIRSGRRAWHRQLGSVSFVLVPIIGMTTINFLHFRVRGAPLDAGVLGMMALVLNALAAFVILFVLAIIYRRQPATHARFMICTIFPLFTPVTDRLIARHLPSFISYIPLVDGSPLLPLAGFALADAILIGLSVWDWRANRRLIFPIALAILVAYHYSVVTFAGFGFWRTMAESFASMQLS
jgi:uncharacterized membrane protein YozB (DUF420 family)